MPLGQVFNPNPFSCPSLRFFQVSLIRDLTPPAKERPGFTPYICAVWWDSLEGDIGEQGGRGEDGRHAAADVGDEGQDLGVPLVDLRRGSRDVLSPENREEGETTGRREERNQERTIRMYVD